MGVGHESGEKAKEPQKLFSIVQALAVCVRVTGADESSLLLADVQRGQLVFAATSDKNGLLSSDSEATGLLGKSVPIGEGVTGMAALTHDVQCAVDDGSAPKRFHRVAGDGKPRAVIAAPVLRDGRLLAVVTAVSFKRRKAFTQEDCRSCGMVANAIAGIMSECPELSAKGRGGMAEATGESDAASLCEDFMAFAKGNPDRRAALRQMLEALKVIAK